MTVTISGTNGVTTPEITVDNTAADGGQVVLNSSGYSNWNWDNYSGRLRAYYGGTEYFTINSSGNVGIGTSSPGSYGAGYTALSVNGSSAGAVIDAMVGGTRYGSFYALSDGSVTIGNIQNNVLAFRTNNTERMRIDSSGNLLVGATATVNSAKTFIYSGIAECIRVQQDAGAGRYPIVFMNGGTTVGSIQTSTTTTSYNTSSDYRLKENIQPMQNALDVVAQLNPVTYTWKADGSDGQGFIAHELQAVVPDCVTGEKDAVDTEGNPVYQGIDTSFLVATLTKAIQELKAELDATKTRLTAAEEQILNLGVTK